MVADYRTVSPGIARLAALIELHGEAIEADLAFRGIDLRDLWRGDLTYRRLAVLVAALPAESLTKTAIRDGMSPAQLARAQASRTARPGHGPWSNSELLLALVADRLGVMIWQNGGKKSAPRPDPIPRPGVAAPGRTVTPQGVAYLADMRARRNRELGREAN